MEMRRHVTRGHPCIYFLCWKRAAGSRNPMLRLTIRSVQHVQEPIHLRLSKFTQGLMLVPLYQVRRQLIWRGHALLHQASKNDQTGMCVEHTKGSVQLWQWRPTENAALFISLLIPLRNEHERRTKMRTSSEQLFTCIFRYIIGYSSRKSLVIDQFVHVHNDPFYSLCCCLEIVHGMQSIMRQNKALPVILPICTYMYCTVR